jgi:cytochrome c oxidase assembly protein subunit 15
VALAATVATYLLILMGGLVRVSGAGLGCPDWPHCFGRWIPPTSVEQLPADIDPEKFNFRLAWTEYINRLFGIVVGLLIAATALLAFRYHRRTPRILYPSIAAALLVAFQGWQGGQVVTSELKPIIVSAHMVIALIIVVLLTYVSHQVPRRDTAVTPNSLPGTMQRLLVVLGVVAIVQTALGIQVRESLEVIAAGFPNLGEREWLTRVGLPNHIHLFVGLLLTVLTWAVIIRILRLKNGLTPRATRFARWLLMLTAAQLLLGLSFVSWGRVPALQLLHMWLPTLYIGVLLLLYLHGRAVRSEP